MSDGALGFLMMLLVAVVVSAVVHAEVKKFLRACLIAAMTSSLIFHGLMYLYTRSLAWFPVTLVSVAVVSFLIAAIVGAFSIQFRK
jgi:hypothetical protein